MSEFSEKNWKDALTSLFNRSMTDPVYRTLCLSNPVAAIQAVSDIELPPLLKFQFFDNRDAFIYSFLLPPTPGVGASSADQSTQLVNWATICTDPTYPPI